MYSVLTHEHPVASINLKLYLRLIKYFTFAVEYQTKRLCMIILLLRGAGAEPLRVGVDFINLALPKSVVRIVHISAVPKLSD